MSRSKQPPLEDPLPAVRPAVAVPPGVDPYALDERRAQEAHSALRESGRLVPVSDDPSQQFRWRDFDLASCAENRLGDVTSPMDLDEERRGQWLEHACERGVPTPAERTDDCCYWIVEGDQAIGTLAVASSSYGGSLLRVSSFYVLPEWRRRDIGTKALAAVRSAAGQAELGVRLDTSWCWQRAVRYYMRRGFWVHMWKHELTLRADSHSDAPRIAIDENSASLAVRVDDEDMVLARASRDGGKLTFGETAEAKARRADKRFEVSAWHARSTLALAIALEGWPLIRSQRDWDDSYFCDAGSPESLAYKITVWEAWNATREWRSDAPRIPGLAYPTWEEFKTAWSRTE